MIEIRVVFAAALKRVGGVGGAAFAETRDCLRHSSGDRFRRSRIAGTLLAADPRLPGCT